MADWFTLGAGALGALGSLGGGFMSAQGAERMNQQNIQFQQQQNDTNYARQWYENRRAEDFYFDQQQWQTHMSNTAYQRATADMRAAGLNPILAYKQGGAGGGSVGAPSGSSAGVSTAPRVENTQADLGRGIGRAVSSATDALTAIGQVENLSEQNALLKQQTAQTQAGVDLTKANTTKALMEAGYTEEQIKQMPFMRDLLIGQTRAAHEAAGASSAAAGLSSASSEAVKQDARRKEQFGDSWLGQVMNTLQQVGRRVGGVRLSHGQGGGVPDSGPRLLRDTPGHWLYSPR